MGDENGTRMQYPEKGSPGLPNPKQSPRLFYGERSRQFPTSGIAPGSKLRRSEHNSSAMMNDSITDDPEKISVPNRSG